MLDFFLLIESVDISTPHPDAGWGILLEMSVGWVFCVCAEAK